MLVAFSVFSSFCSCSSWTCGRRVANADDDLFLCVKKGDTARVRELLAQGQSPYDRCDGSLYHALGTTTDKHMSDYAITAGLRSIVTLRLLSWLPMKKNCKSNSTTWIC